MSNSMIFFDIYRIPMQQQQNKHFRPIDMAIHIAIHNPFAGGGVALTKT